MPAKELTPEQKQDAERLKAKFRAWQAEKAAQGEPTTQEQLNDQLGFGQSATSQYLNGRIPLNPDAAARFAALIGCNVSAFSPAIAQAIQAMASSAQSNTPKRLLATTMSDRRKGKWPFARIDHERMVGLGHDDALRLETAILLAAAQLGIDIAAPHQAKRKAA